MAVAAAVFCGALLLAAWSVNAQFDQSARARRDICHAVNNLNLAITASLKRSQLNIPRLAYYREHPAERAQQQAEIQRELVVFRPRGC